VDSGVPPDPPEGTDSGGPPDPPEPPPSGRPGTTTVDVTRFLAAAAYLDETFRDEVITQTLHQKYRFIAPSYGLNIGCVVRHCIASRRLSRRRDLILSALILIGVWALHLPLLAAAAVFVGGVLVAMGLASPRVKLRWKIVLSAVAYVAFIAFALHPLSLLTAVAALFVVIADLYERRYHIVATRMNAKVFHVDAPAYGRESPRQRRADERQIAHLRDHQNGNVVVYSGFSPFIGSGVQLKRWAFTINVKPARDGRPASDPVEPVDPKGMHAHVVRAIKDLDLDGWSVADRFFASGRHVRADGRTELFFHPLGRGEKFRRLKYVIDEVGKVEALPQELVRKYADIKVMSWQSELVLSTFLRFSQTSPSRLRITSSQGSRVSTTKSTPGIPVRRCTSSWASSATASPKRPCSG
jgi:hypothetical protein